MTQMNKFEDVNNRFVSLGTGMTRQHKFRDRWWTLQVPVWAPFLIEDGGVGSVPQSGLGGAWHWARKWQPLTCGAVGSTQGPA